MTTSPYLDEIRGIPLVGLRQAGGSPGRLELGRLELGRLELGRLELGRLELGRLELGRLELGRLELGRLEKRAFDLVAAAVLLVLVAPVLGVLAIAVRLDSGGPALFRQERITRSGRITKIVKLRTVVGDHDADTLWSPPAGRCTRLGTWLRETHLDELPQLVNVLSGQISLVGPRPERPYHARRFASTVPGYGDRHRVPAGITGWAQVHGLSGDTSIPDRVRLDNQYIDCWSLRLDLVILWQTLLCALPRPFRGRSFRRAGTETTTKTPKIIEQRGRHRDECNRESAASRLPWGRR